MPRERTFLAIKPDGVQRGHVGEIISRFERKGFKLVGMKMMVPPMELLEQHYAEHKGKPFYPSLTGFMSSSAVVAMVWEGNNVVSIARKMMGATKPLDAAPGTIRGDFAMSPQENIVHTSDSPENARIELDRFFSPEDYCEYPSPLGQYLYAPDEK